MSRRVGKYALGVSVTVHVALLIAFTRAPPPSPEPLHRAAVELDVAVVSPRSLTAPKPVVATAEAVSKRPHPLRRRHKDPQNSPSIAQEPMAESSVETNKHQHAAESPERDPKNRLWSFGDKPYSLVSPLVDRLPTEDPRALTPKALPNVIRRPKNEEIGREVEGRGEVKMRLRDGRIEGFEDPQPEAHFAIGPGMIGVAGKFDLNDSVLRALGGKPYRYEQGRLAESTREERICQMLEADRRDRRQALFELKGRLNALVAQPDMTLAQQHTLLFELWDECLEGNEADSQGAAARATIEAFIRERMPAEGTKAYTTAELAMLNRRRTSKASFDPYGKHEDRRRQAL